MLEKNNNHIKRPISFIIILLFLISIFLSINFNLKTSNAQSFINIQDSENDLRALRLTNKYEIINITDSMEYIDIVNLLWTNDSLGINISLEFADNVIPEKIYNGSVFGWVFFKNSSSITPANEVPILKVDFYGNDTIPQLNGNVQVFDKTGILNYSNCVVIDGKYINWSIPSEFIKNCSIFKEIGSISTWQPLCFIVYINKINDETYIYWDCISYTSYYDMVWDDLNNIIGRIDGINVLNVVSVVLIANLLIVLKIRKKIKNFKCC